MTRRLAILLCSWALSAASIALAGPIHRETTAVQPQPHSDVPVARQGEGERAFTLKHDPAGEAISLIESRDYRVAGISIGDGRAEVLAALGTPLLETDAGLDADASPVTLRYAGIEVYLEADEVMNIVVSVPGYPVKGVEVGTSLAEARRRLGVGAVQQCQGACLRFTVRAPNGVLTDAHLLLHLEDERVARIEFWFDYT